MVYSTDYFPSLIRGNHRPVVRLAYHYRLKTIEIFLGRKFRIISLVFWAWIVDGNTSSCITGIFRVTVFICKVLVQRIGQNVWFVESRMGMPPANYQLS